MSQTTYPYVAAPTLPARHYSGHGTSSAFSSSANPDEDWTKISDLAERRRIQNRIAQRNYRKKLKMRLEELERRAGSSSEPSPTGAKPAKSSSRRQQRPPVAQSRPATQSQPATLPPQPVPEHQLTPPMHPDDYVLPPAPAHDREACHNPPPFFACPTYPAPSDDMFLSPYAVSQPLSVESYPNYIAAPVPVPLPSMAQFGDSPKHEPSYPGDDSLDPYLNYVGYFPGFGIGAGTPSPYEHVNPHTPPLMPSFDQSTDCSESGSYEYPTTPLSMPGSPGMYQQPM